MNYMPLYCFWYQLPVEGRWENKWNLWPMKIPDQFRQTPHSLLPRRKAALSCHFPHPYHLAPEPQPQLNWLWKWINILTHMVPLRMARVVSLIQLLSQNVDTMTSLKSQEIVVRDCMRWLWWWHLKIYIKCPSQIICNIFQPNSNYMQIFQHLKALHARHLVSLN